MGGRWTKRLLVALLSICTIVAVFWALLEFASPVSGTLYGAPHTVENPHDGPAPDTMSGWAIVSRVGFYVHMRSDYGASKMVCAGGVWRLPRHGQVTVNITCNGGRQGIAVLSGDRYAAFDQGYLRFSDGSEVMFFYGPRHFVPI